MTETTEEQAHAPLPPSSAEQWVNCGRSASLSAANPEPETDETREGTAAHWVLSERLVGSLHEPGERDPDGTLIDADMILAADKFVSHLTEMLGGDLSSLNVECRVYMTRIHPTDNWGTCDVFVVDMKNRIVYIVDYKYGFGYVEAKGNWQMTDYAQGVRERFGLEGPFDVCMTIFQPRYYGPEGQWRQYRMPAAEHAERVEALRMAAKLSSPNAAATTGPWCTHCSGRVACAPFLRLANRVGEISGQASGGTPTAEEAGLELVFLHQAQKYLKARVTALETLVKAHNDQGRSTGFVTEQGYGREKWTEDAETIFALGDMLALDFRKKPEAITPEQAVKLGLDPEVKAAYSYKPKGELKLVPNHKSRVMRAFEQE